VEVQAMKRIVIVVSICIAVTACGSRSVCNEALTCNSDNPIAAADSSVDGLTSTTADGPSIDSHLAQPGDATFEGTAPALRDAYASLADASAADANVRVRPRDASADAARGADATIDGARAVDSSRARDAAIDVFVEPPRDSASEAEPDARVDDASSPSPACSRPPPGDPNCQRATMDYLCQMPDDTTWVLFASGAALHFRAADGPHIIVCELDTDGGLVAQH
jgi:hypothetical protein